VLLILGGTHAALATIQSSGIDTRLAVGVGGRPRRAVDATEVQG